ncbi:MAG: DUF6364 family protein [Thermoanaerobaculales bacterium]|nr:DUF6364 family protein [Thermoanaerobaculales bacterium]
MPNRSKLTVRLPDESLKFLKQYAAEHGLTVTAVLCRFLKRLQEGASEEDIHPNVARMSGIVPTEVDSKVLYHDHLLEKHQ